MNYKKTVVLLCLFLLCAGLIQFIEKSERIQPNKSFAQFPMKINNWEGNKGALDEEIYNILGVEDYILANYRKQDAGMVNLYIGFYQSQKEGDIIHSPKNCMPGAGWNIAETSIETVPINQNNTKIKVIKLLIVRGAEKQVVLYWFHSRGRIIASEYMQKIWLVYDSIFRQRTDGSFVRLVAPVNRDEKTTTNILKEFAVDLYPVLLDFIPS